MLRVDFINVGDGDSILVRYRPPGARKRSEEYVMLVDCGRQAVAHSGDSRRMEASAYLSRAGIDHIDLLLLTHLHFDHIGGAPAILRRFPVRALLAGYYPPPAARRVVPPVEGQKTITGLYGALNLFADIVSQAEQQGASRLTALPVSFAPAPGLEVTVHRPVPLLSLRQQALFDRIYHGLPCTETELYEASKGRNCTSLIVRLCYAGVSVLLTGDAYAACWEDAEEAPCDILKLPHHGDAKSMTEPLLRRLSPRYAVISCQNDSPKRKERPAGAVTELLLRHVPHVLCTENRPMPGLRAASHDAVRFVVDAHGHIRCPEARQLRPGGVPPTASFPICCRTADGIHPKEPSAKKRNRREPL